MTWQTWRGAMQEALYGTDGFYRRVLPGEHFRTSVTSGPVFAEAVRRLADLVDAALGHPDPFDVVDLGAGGGELLAGLGVVPDRWRLTPVELSGRFTATTPRLRGLMIANEWLDNVPLDVVEDGRVVEVDRTGQERLGPPAAHADLAWADRWWPIPARAEVGRSRDEAWAAAVEQVEQGLAVAIDYGHVVGSRRATLTGYREGRQVLPVPDGSRDLTAHVAVDSCAAATGARLVPQREALQLLGVDGRPPRSGDLTALQRAGEAGRLLDPHGLGGFTWLVQPVGIDDPLRAPL